MCNLHPYKNNNMVAYTDIVLCTGERKEQFILLILMSMTISNGPRAVFNCYAFSKLKKKWEENVDVKSIAECGLQCKNIHTTNMINIADWKACVNFGMMFKLGIAFARNSNL